MSPARRLEEGELHDRGVWRGLLGTKVSLRYRLRDDPDNPFSEAIGMVQAVGGDEITIVNRRGEARDVPLGDVEAAKTFSD